MGVSSDHPSVSGLNAYGGINMHGNDIGNTDIISVNRLVGNAGTGIEIDANPTIKGTLLCDFPIRGHGFANNVDEEDLWIQVGDTSSTGGGWKQIKIRNGLIYQIN